MFLKSTKKLSNRSLPYYFYLPFLFYFPECPPTCACFSEIDELKVECKILNLASVPAEIPDSVREL